MGTKFVNRLTVFKKKKKLVKTNGGCMDNDYVLDVINMIRWFVLDPGIIPEINRQELRDTLYIVSQTMMILSADPSNWPG